jgi:hypothetical protein
VAHTKTIPILEIGDRHAHGKHTDNSALDGDDAEHDLLRTHNCAEAIG